MDYHAVYYSHHTSFSQQEAYCTTMNGMNSRRPAVSNRLKYTAYLKRIVEDEQTVRNGIVALATYSRCVYLPLTTARTSARGGLNYEKNLSLIFASSSSPISVYDPLQFILPARLVFC